MSGDQTDALAEAVRQAAAERRALRIVGGDSKRFYGRAVAGEPLSTTGHCGIVAYDPTELVVTVRAGTRLTDLEAELRTQRQMLCFEPPRFATSSTIGGVVAAGLAGPRRPFSGAVRDSVLGVRIVDGRGQLQRFGGVVFKNVAGFDAFRLMAGSLGCLGVILELSLRVMPIPRAEQALVCELSPEAAPGHLADLLRRALPISGACFDGAHLHLRLSGGVAAVREALQTIGGEPESLGFWEAVRDHRHPFFERRSILWRVAVPAATPQLAVDGDWLWDWAGAQRWLAADEPHAKVRALALASRGHATLVKGASADGEVFTPLPTPLYELHRRLKAAFDPSGILNPGRMYAGF